MNKNTRVIHQRGFSLKLNQALKGIENCAFGWVKYGESIRDLTPAEAITARNGRARLLEPLPSAEIPGLIFEPPINAQAATRQEYRLANEANLFAAPVSEYVM